MSIQTEIETTLDNDVIAKFEKVLNDESMLHAGSVSHQANNVNIPEVPEAK